LIGFRGMIHKKSRNEKNDTFVEGEVKLGKLRDSYREVENLDIYMRSTKLVD